MRNLFVPKIGDPAIAEATPDRLQRYLDGVRLEHGPGAAKSARAVLSGMMGLAARSDAVRSNPVRELAPVGGRVQGSVAVPLEDLPRLLSSVRADEKLQDQDLVDVVAFVAGTGARISETLAWTWDAVDLAAGTVTIRMSKTDAGERTIRLPTAIVGMLGDRRLQSAPTAHGLVFTDRLGRSRDSRAVMSAWRYARDRVGFSGTTFHSFRKTVATALDQAGLTPRDIAEYLGHSDPSLTMGTYMSKIVGGSRAADALDALVK